MLALLGLVGLLPAKADTSAARILRRTDDDDDDNDDDEAAAFDASNRFMILGVVSLYLSFAGCYYDL